MAEESSNNAQLATTTGEVNTSLSQNPTPISQESLPSSISNNNNNNNNSAQPSIKTRRRSSLIPAAGLNLGGISAIPQPILESLPTTPAPGTPYKEPLSPFATRYTPQGEETIRFNEPGNSGIETLPSSPTGRVTTPGPEQIISRPRLKKNNTTTTITRLLGESADIDENVMSLMNPPSNFYRVIAGCCWTFVLGMSDGCLGALLPSIEKYYGISYALVSLIWLGNAIGFIIVAFTAHLFDQKFGKHIMLTVSAACFTVCYAIVSSGTKFPGIVVGFFFAGLGGAIGLSTYNIFMSKLLNGSKYLGFFHGTYGIGATVSPLIGTAMINKGIVWHYYFFIPLSISVLNVLFIFVAFKGCDTDLKRWDHVDDHSHNQDDREMKFETPALKTEEIELDYLNHKKANAAAETTKNLGTSATHNDPSVKTSNETHQEEGSHDFKAALQDMRSWLVCIFIFFYQGSEVSMGGWVVTFLLEYRDGSTSSTGYVSSGFWGGVAVGRLFLTHRLVNNFGSRRSIIIISLSIIALDILAWFVPSAIASAVFSCAIGLCIGPVYPMMIALVTKFLPRKIRFCAMTLGTAFGSSGGSAVPFAIGIASQFTGTWILHPIFLACYVMVLAAWLAMPNVERKGAIKSIWQRLW